MSILNTFLNKISKKVDERNIVYDNRERDAPSDEHKPKNEINKPIDSSHTDRPKLIKYLNAKQYFKKLDDIQGDSAVARESSFRKKTIKNTLASSKRNMFWPLFDDPIMDQKFSTLLWLWIEKPFLSLVLPKKNVWWVMGENNQYFPDVTNAPFGNQNILRSYIIHILIWIPIFYIYYNHPICPQKTQKPVIAGFLFGIICFLFLDILNNNNTDLLVDKSQMEWTISHSENQTDDITVMEKNSEWDGIFGSKDTTHGLLFKPEKFPEFAIKNNINLLPLKDWYSDYWKKSVGSSGPENEERISRVSTANNAIRSSGYYLISNIVTIGIVTAKANLKYFRFITPLILLISCITICGIYDWVWTYHASESYNQLNFKRKILIEAISISITCCLLVINCNFFKNHNYIYDKIFL